MAVSVLPHPRAIIVEKARNAYTDFVTELQAKFSLTHAEVLKIIGSEMSSLASVAIMEERDVGNSNKEKP